MEVFHRLRIFENVEDTGDFPFIVSSLRLATPAIDGKISFTYAKNDSSYIANNHSFRTSWGQVHSSGQTRELRLYLYGGVTSVNAKTPTVLVSTSATPSSYNTGLSPYDVANTYYIYFSGATAEYLNSQESSVSMGAGFQKGNHSTERLLLSDMYPEVYGPFIRTRHKIEKTSIGGVYMAGISHDVYHITQSHWIDVSKLIPCYTDQFGQPSYSKAYHIDDKPGEFVKVVDGVSCTQSYNDSLLEAGTSNWTDKRCNALVKNPSGPELVLRPVVMEEGSSSGYKVYLSSIIDNILSTTSDYNSEFSKMYNGVVFTWDNIQIWEGSTYLSADVMAYCTHGGDITLNFSNVSYIVNGVAETPENAMQKAEDTIMAAKNHTHRLDIYAVIQETDAIICTTELCTDLLYNRRWWDAGNYGNSFIEGGSRYEGPQSYSGSPAYISNQYKVYASSETPYAASYTVKEEGPAKDTVINDEFHYMTSITPFGNTFIYRTYDATNTQKWMLYPVAEMKIGIMWDNIYYDPNIAQ